MKSIFPYLPIFLLLIGCSENGVNDTENQLKDSSTSEVIADTIRELPIEEKATELTTITNEAIDDWKSPNPNYLHFNSVPLDTVYIGLDREITSLKTYFSEDRSNVLVFIDEGRYVHTGGLWVGGENIIIKGIGNVSILCDELYENVMWVTGENVVVDNLHMMHLMPDTGESQNCSGRVIGFDGADNVTIINCDLNGCGLAGLHDNLGNGTIYAEYNYIHNNSLGAYTDIDGNVWQEEVDNHPTFKFKNNRIQNNGFDHVPEDDYYEEDSYDH